MSEFTSDGFKPFPNTFEDNKRVGSCSEWSDDVIENKVTEYWLFLERKDIMPRAVEVAHRVLDHLGFEMDYRYGTYDTMLRLEDDTCDGE